MLTSFPVSIGPFACSLEKYLFGCSDHFWLFLVIEFCEFLVCFVYEPLVRYTVYKCFLSFGRLPLYFASVDEMVRTELPGICFSPWGTKSWTQLSDCTATRNIGDGEGKGEDEKVQ